jgi:hypothetical protein
VWSVRQPKFGVRKSSDLGLISPWNSNTRDSHRCQEEVCTEFCQDSHVCDLSKLLNMGRRTPPRVRRALNAPEHAQRPTPRAPRQATPVSPALARAYKASQGFSRTPPRALNLTGAQDRRSFLCTLRASGRPSTRHRRPASRAIPRLVQPLRETLRA